MTARPSVHLIGIGGDGMSSLARLYLDAGWRVSGSDQIGGEKASALTALGAVIWTGHDPAHVTGASLVVHSPAIPRGNPELTAARTAGIPVLVRTRALTGLIAAREVICVAGSHGKTTTTSMLSLILDRAGCQPGYMAGGTTDALGDVAGRLGRGPLFVAETCEAFRALDLWQPRHCIVTNVDDEHSDHYGGRDRLEEAFAEFVARVPANGKIVLCGDDVFLGRLDRETPGRVIDYGFGEGRQVRPGGLIQAASDSVFEILFHGRALARLTLPVPGRHNVLNALGALGMALALGLDAAVAAAALADFKPVRRRWQHLATSNGVHVFDDFAHHPTEIAATLRVARRVAAGHGVVAVLQPQLASRVTRLAPDYARALREADRVWLLPTDLSGEPGDRADADRRLGDALAADGVAYDRIDPTADGEPAVVAALQPGDVVVAMGQAGARRFAHGIVDHLNRRTDGPSVTRRRRDVPPPNALLHAAFERNARAQPGAACLIHERTVWTYERLDTEANRVAEALRARGMKPDALVALHLRKSPWLVALMLGALKAGGAFVPIDPKMTRPGLQSVLRRAGVVLTLTDQAEAARRSGLTDALELSDFLNALPETATAAPCTAGPGSLAYGMFTSGSTGTPRLVGVEHRNIVSVIGYAAAELLTAEDCRLVPMLASISFDACISQMFPTLTIGGTLLLVQDPAELVRSEHYSQLSMMGMTPTMLRALLEAAPLPPRLRTLGLGGEATPTDLLSTLRAMPALRRVRNYYGPAEATLYSLTTLFHDGEANAPPAAASGTLIGKPIAGTHVHLIGADGAAAPDGGPGEIVIVGPGVSRGYLGEPDATAQRFGADPCGGPMRSYRTGDWGRRLPGGQYEFLGRADDQVKINGARIELGEVEAHLLACPGVFRAAALHVTHPDAGPRLVAYVVTGPMMDVGFVRQWLRERVAAVLVPQEILQIGAMPLQISGKIDRRALARTWRDRTLAAPQNGAAPRRSSEDIGERVLQLWRQVLRCPVLQSDENFFASGGDSLAAMKLVLKVEDEFGWRLKGDLADHLTSSAAMANTLRDALASAEAPAEEDGRRRIDVILQRQRQHLTGWPGQRRTPDRLVVTLNPKGAGPGLFWCFQSYEELAALAGALGDDYPVHGMRSGHLVMDYTPDTLAALAGAYCEELIAVNPGAPVCLGGNCQGASVARALALALRGRGQTVERLILMEQAKLWYYDEPVELIYGRESGVNPLRTAAEVESALARSYPKGARLHEIAGGHGQFFTTGNVGSLATALRDILSGAAV